MEDEYKILKNYVELSDDFLEKIIFKSSNINTPYGEKSVIYADFIASGLPSPYVESYIYKHVYPHYANTHSNANNGMLMKNMIEETRIKIKQDMNVDIDKYKVIFTGSGATSAVNLLVNLINYKMYEDIHIFLTTYEHYSNYLPWLEIAKKYKHITIHVVPFKENEKNFNGEVNINYIKDKIKEIETNNIDIKNTLIICSIIACSNVNGIEINLGEIENILLSINNKNIKHYLFADYACCAPYKEINASKTDALFFSPHKFIGGTATPGILMAKKDIFEKKEPFIPGGGCVKKLYHDNIVYLEDVELKETAGTMNIVGILKLNRIFEVKRKLIKVIKENDRILSQLMKNKIKCLENKYPTFKTILYNDNENHLPILSFSITNLHYNFIVVLLSDLFGIQSRGGMSCCGKLGEYMKENYSINGWCRISFHWTMKKEDIIKIYDSVEFIIINGENYSSSYDYNEEKNLFKYKN